MSLSRKVTLFIILTFMASGLMSFAIQQLFIMPSFIALEKETAIKNAERVLAAIDREFYQIAPSVADWAIWTDTYNYVKGSNPGFIEANLDDGPTLGGLGMNFLGIYDIDGKSVWTQAINLESLELLDLERLTGAGLSINHPLMQHKSLKSELRGIVPTTVAPLLVVAKPILYNDESGPIAGTMMMGRFLDDSVVEKIAELTKLSITTTMLRQPSIPANLIVPGNASPGLAHTEYKMVETLKHWQVQTTLADSFNNPIIVLQVDTPRDISSQGASAVSHSLWLLAATGMLVMLVLWKFLQQAILNPVAKLTDHALRIGENDNLTIRLNLQREDEVGILAHTFDQMVDRLAETRRRLVDLSYHSGIAEMASGVLHNIGNAITPLNVRLATLQQELRTAPLAEMNQALAELADPATPSERRADLKQFVELAGGEMAKLIKDSQEKLAAALQQVGQVQGILTDQQRFSRSARLVEAVDMVAAIRDAEHGLILEMQKLLGVNITESVAECGKVAGARAALQQVIANILINAAESIQANVNETGHFTVTAEKKVMEGISMVEFCFEDNGAGISPDHIKRLFERGFSTKNREGSGYGLHWSANTLMSLGGRLSAESGGIGTGASMFVLLPAAEELTQQISATLKDHNELRN